MLAKYFDSLVLLNPSWIIAPFDRANSICSLLKSSGPIHVPESKIKAIFIGPWQLQQSVVIICIVAFCLSSPQILHLGTWVDRLASPITDAAVETLAAKPQLAKTSSSVLVRVFLDDFLSLFYPYKKLFLKRPCIGRQFFQIRNVRF